MRGVDGTARSGLGHLLDRLAREQGFSVIDVQPIDPGVTHNNRLYRLRAVDGRMAVVKCYFRDNRHRLEREHEALAFLQTRGIAGVPKPFLRDDVSYAAVYSFEDGVTKPGEALTTAELEALAALVGTLRRIRPGQPGATFLPGVAAVFSLAEGVARLRARLAAFQRFAASAAVYPVVRQACDTWDPPGAIACLLDRALDGLSPAELEARIPEAAWGFAQGDLAPHNVLVQPGGRVCLVDFEYSGWDDPAAPAAAFLAADTSRGLTPTGAAAFVSAYRDAAELTADEVRRMDRWRALMEVNWAAVHLSLLTPERIAPKQFADPRLDLDRHLAEQLHKLRCRLAVGPTASRPGQDQ